MKLLRILVGVVLVLAGAAGGAWMWLKSSVQPREGTHVVAGLAEPVEVAWDIDGIPHIRAGGERDALRALGFVHAQERLWQMEFQRRVGTGRLAEVAGAGALRTDRFIRTLGLGRAAQKAYEKLDDDTRGVVEAYTEGVNAQLDARRGPLPPEFLVLGSTFAPWRPVDSLAWAKVMALDLADNRDDELLRARLLLSGLNEAEVNEAMPGAQPAGAPTIIHALAPAQVHDTMFAWRGAGFGGGAQASNSWVVHGSRTTTGKALLANDPHLGTSTPSLWFLAHLRCREWESMGATLPGTGPILIGRTRHLAWGLTNLMADNQDMFVHRLNPADPTQYEVDGKYVPFTVREEKIAIKGGGEEVLRVRETRHGPVMDDAAATASGTVMALRWTGLDEEDFNLRALLRMNRARTLDEFRTALPDWHAASQNIVVADDAGHIAMFSVGALPIRATGNGTWPTDGTRTENDWKGYVPFEEMPRVVDPPEGMVITANNKVAPDSYPHHVSSTFAAPYRYQRIHDVLASKERVDPETMVAAQRDIVSLHARIFLPLLQSVSAGSDRARAALAAVQGWDGTMAVDAVAPAVFWTWYRRLVEGVARDEMGDVFDDWNASRTFFMQAATAGRTGRAWCDDKATPAVETCKDIAGRALERAVTDLQERLGDDVNTWTWGRVHTMYFPHHLLDGTPVVGDRFSTRSPVGGDGFTPNVAPAHMGRRWFEAREHPSYRQVVDMANPEQSRFVAGVGQGGNVLGDDYRGHHQAWLEGRYVPMQMDVPQDRIRSVQRLVPAGGR